MVPRGGDHQPAVRDVEEQRRAEAARQRVAAVRGEVAFRVAEPDAVPVGLGCGAEKFARDETEEGQSGEVEGGFEVDAEDAVDDLEDHFELNDLDVEANLDVSAEEDILVH